MPKNQGFYASKPRRKLLTATFRSSGLQTPSIFSQIIARCLAKTPADRFAGPIDLLDHLSRVCKTNNIALPPKPKVMGQNAKELLALAVGLGALGNYQEAIEAARELITLEPEDAEGWTQLARLLANIEDDEGAMSAIEKSLALDETRSPAWNNFGVLLTKQRKWQRSIYALDRALDCDPFNTGAMLNCTEPLRRLGRSGEARVRLKRAAEIAPDKFAIWNNLAEVYIGIDDKQNALDCLRQARALAPDRYRKQIDERIEFAKILPDEPSGTALMASNPALAKRRLREKTLSNPDDKDAWHNLGVLHWQAKEYAESRECFSRVLALNPSDDFAISRLIELSAALKDIAAVEHWCSVLSKMPSGQMAAIAFKARALVQCDKYDDARSMILDAVEKYPDESDIMVACGDVMMTYPDSSTAMSNAVTSYSRAVEILNNGIDIARTREIEARLNQARQHLDRCKRDAAGRA